MGERRKGVFRHPCGGGLGGEIEPEGVRGRVATDHHANFQGPLSLLGRGLHCSWGSGGKFTVDMLSSLWDGLGKPLGGSAHRAELGEGSVADCQF